MEPPAVTSCGVGNHPSLGQMMASGGGGPNGIVGQGQLQHGQQKRDMSSFIQIDPQISFNTPSRHFEELPENFLETISPQQQGHGQGGLHPGSMGGPLGLGGQTTNSPQLASLTTVSMATGAGDANSAYANLVPMPGSSHYINALKMESMEHLGHHPQLHSAGALEKTSFGNGPAGLLSPLQLESTRNEGSGGASSLGLLVGGVVPHHGAGSSTLGRPNGGSRTSDLLSGIRRTNVVSSVSYIKEEINPVAEMGGYQSGVVQHDYGTGGYGMEQPSAQELERMANAETPPALSNVEITSSILASLSRDSPSPNLQQHSPHQTHFIVHQMARPSGAQPQQLVQTHHGPQPSGTGGSRRQSKKQAAAQHQQQHNQMGPAAAAGYGPMGPGAGIPRASYSTTDTTDPLNAEIDDEIYIDTKDLCKRVAYELKQHSIPQAIFAERILCRSQGTLSDLLRNPKPWNRLKSGRETFRRMFNWLQQPLHIRLSILDMYKGPMASGAIPPPTPAQNSRHHHRNRRASDAGDEAGNPPQKRPRLVFTDIQKRTLQAIFKETQRPSREMQQTIAEHLRLDMSTVSNFFMNARRRSRNGNGMGDEPAPYQQVRTITPPPDSPPTAQQQHHVLVEHHHHLVQPAAPSMMIPSSSHMPARRAPKAHHAPPSASNLSHIEETVDEVVGRSVAYARSKQLQEQQQHSFEGTSASALMEQPPLFEDLHPSDEDNNDDEQDLSDSREHVEFGRDTMADDAEEMCGDDPTCSSSLDKMRLMYADDEEEMMHAMAQHVPEEDEEAAARETANTVAAILTAMNSSGDGNKRIEEEEEEEEEERQGESGHHQQSPEAVAEAGQDDTRVPTAPATPGEATATPEKQQSDATEAMVVGEEAETGGEVHPQQEGEAEEQAQPKVDSERTEEQNVDGDVASIKVEEHSSSEEVGTEQQPREKDSDGRGE